MIPRTLHHIWHGPNQPTALMLECRQSFAELHPGWEFQYHRDDSLLIHPNLASIHGRLRGAWERFGKGNARQSGLALQADLLRLCAIFVDGGIFVDHDLFCLKPFDRFLDEDLLLAQFVPSCPGEFVMGAPAGSPQIWAILDKFADHPDAQVITMGLKWWINKEKWKSYPPEWFCPHPRNDRINLYRVTENTHSIHLWHHNRYELDKLKALQQQPCTA